MMPGFDGVETLRRIREINNGMYQELPVVALTANTISGAREMFRQEGFTEFIPKPIERSTLERVLRKVLPEEAFSTARRRSWRYIRKRSRSRSPWFCGIGESRYRKRLRKRSRYRKRLRKGAGTERGCE